MIVIAIECVSLSIQVFMQNLQMDSLVTLVTVGAISATSAVAATQLQRMISNGRHERALRECSALVKEREHAVSFVTCLELELNQTLLK